MCNDVVWFRLNAPRVCLSITTTPNNLHQKVTKNLAEILNLLKTDKNSTFGNWNHGSHSRDIVIHMLSSLQSNLKRAVQMGRENVVFNINESEFTSLSLLAEQNTFLWFPFPKAFDCAYDFTELWTDRSILMNWTGKAAETQQSQYDINWHDDHYLPSHLRNVLVYDLFNLRMQ